MPSVAVTWFLAESFVNTSHKRGLRGSVYDLAGKNGAFHFNVEKESISYDSNKVVLTVRLLFSHLSQCGIFQSKLEDMVKRHFDSEAIVLHKREYVGVAWSSKLQAVLASDYVSTDNPESEQYSIFSNRSSADAIDIDETMQPILWENAALTCFNGGCKGERCHLMSQTSYTQHASNENNILIMSAENHSRFDGHKPKICIKWVRETDQIVNVHGEELIVCDISIICINDAVFRCVGSNLKIGAATDAANKTYHTSVAVPNPSLFKQFLTFKYLESVGLQTSDESEIGRVRAEVTERMRQQFDDLTIDLDPKPTNKRNIAAVDGSD